MESKRKALQKKLRSFWDDDDFVNGTLCILRDDHYISKMLDFIEMAEERGDSLTSDDILLLAVVFDREKEKISV